MHLAPIFLLATAIATPVATPVADVPGRTLACGMNISDWCPAPPGDPCGRHRDTAACKADPACYGMPYRGESFVPCVLDQRGFSSNCPTVGCTSTPPPRGR
jgi:hypothetical protein